MKFPGLLHDIMDSSVLRCGSDGVLDYFSLTSVPVRSLMCLAYDTLGEAVEGSNEGALNLCHSVSNMFELYCDVVPAYHREKLRTLHLMAGQLKVFNCGNCKIFQHI